MDNKPTLKALGENLKREKELKKMLEDQIKDCTANIDSLEEQISNMMLELEMSSTRIDGVGQLVLTNKIKAVVAQELFEKFKNWLTTIGQASIIKEGVNYQTLQSFANELSPELLKAAHDNGLNYTEVTTVSLRK